MFFGRALQSHGTLVNLKANPTGSSQDYANGHEAVVNIAPNWCYIVMLLAQDSLDMKHLEE